MTIRFKDITFEGYNKPRLIKDDKYKAAVLARQKVNGEFKVRLIKFGDANAGHNFSPEARKAFKSRFASLLKKFKDDKFSRIFWADKFLWNPRGIKRNPPKEK
tara:strand:+ start:1715 stop:2023 length:309 start_codon:yes stop_codon:yes gene_type:complete